MKRMCHKKQEEIMPLVSRQVDWKKLIKEGFLGVPESEKNKKISDQIEELKELFETKQIRTEVLLSLALEKENVTQDQFDVLMNLLKDLGRQKGFKVE